MTQRPKQLSAREAYELWAETWEWDPNPFLCLEGRHLHARLPELEGKVFVDASCGTGRHLRNPFEDGARAVGFDFSPAMLAEAVDTMPDLEGFLACGDLHRPPILERSADMVLCTLSLGHTPRPADALEQLANLVRPGGCLLISDFHPRAAEWGWRRTFKLYGRVYEIETYPYEPEELNAAAVRAGMQPTHASEHCVDEPERPLFVDMGEEERFEKARSVPAVLIMEWARL